MNFLARQARQKSFTGYFHVIVRGVGKQILFEEDKDYGYYVALLDKYSKETKVDICAYCLMENHVHMLVHDASDDLAQFMKKMGVSYATYYKNEKEKASS